MLSVSCVKGFGRVLQIAQSWPSWGHSQHFSWKAPVIICQHWLPGSIWMEFLSLSLLRTSPVKHLTKNTGRMLPLSVPKSPILSAGVRLDSVKRWRKWPSSILCSFLTSVSKTGLFLHEKNFLQLLGLKTCPRGSVSCFHLYHPSCQTQLLDYGTSMILAKLFSRCLQLCIYQECLGPS